MKKVLILGVGNFSQMMKKYFERHTDKQVSGFLCHRQYKKCEALDGLPVYAIEEVNMLCPSSDFCVLPSIGYTAMGKVRSEIVLELREKGYEFTGFIHPSVNWFGDRIGEGNIIFENVTFCINVTIGNFNIIFNNCAISHNVDIGDFNHFSPCVALSGCVKVGNHCFLGTNSTLRNEIEIADYTLVGAGAYVRKTTKEYSVIVPSKSIALEGINSLDVNI